MGDAKWSDLREPLQANGNSIGTGDGVSIDGLQVSPPRSVGSGLTLASVTLAADWPVGITAYFAVDYDAGSDDNLGFSLIDLPAAGASPIKTLEELAARLPKVGNGRKAVVAIKARAGGAAYRNKADTADDNLDLSGIVGYDMLIVRGTATAASASSVAFDNSPGDKVYLGAQIVPGTNVPGYNPTGAPTVSTFDCQLAGGGAPGLAAEFALTLKRIRFDAATTTVALRNVTRNIWQNDTDTITVTQDLPAVPVLTDVFYIEEPGVAASKIIVDAPLGNNLLTTFPDLSVAGIRTVSATTDSCHLKQVEYMILVFCDLAGDLLLSGGRFFQLQVMYVDESGVTRDGGGTRIAGTFSMQRTIQVNSFSSGSVSAGRSTLFQIPNYRWGVGGVQRGGLLVTGCGLHGAENSGTPFVTLGNASDTTFRRLRITSAPSDAGITMRRSSGAIGGVDITGAGANPAIKLEGVRTAVAIDDAVGSTGNTGVGVDVAGCRQSSIEMGRTTANTITGTAGDIRVAGPAITTHAGLATTNVVDNEGNNMVGTGAAVVGQCVLISNQSGGALAIGKIVRSNAVATQVTSAQADTVANARGVLGVTVTTPAAGALGYIAVTDGPWVQFDAVPTVGNLAYLSEATAGNARDTPPPLAGTNQKLRHGYIEDVSGTLGRVVWQTEMVSILSDGLAP